MQHQSLASCSCELPTAQKRRELEKEAVLGQLHSLAVGARVCVCHSGCRCAHGRRAQASKSVSVSFFFFVHGNACNVTTQMLHPLGSEAHRIYRAALQRLALHFQTSNFSLSNVALINTSSPEETPQTHPSKPNSARKFLPASCLVEQKS